MIVRYKHQRERRELALLPDWLQDPSPDIGDLDQVFKEVDLDPETLWTLNGIQGNVPEGLQ